MMPSKVLYLVDIIMNVDVTFIGTYLNIFKSLVTCSSIPKNITITRYIQ